MSDIVERLRLSVTKGHEPTDDLAIEAADEIERLTAENDVLHKTDKWRYENVLLMKAEIERLRAIRDGCERMLQERAADLERLQAALRSAPCPSCGWNGMPDIEPTVAACMDHGVCGCDLGRALEGK